MRVEIEGLTETATTLTVLELAGLPLDRHCSRREKIGPVPHGRMGPHTWEIRSYPSLWMWENWSHGMGSGVLIVLLTSGSSNSDPDQPDQLPHRHTFWGLG